MEIMSHSACARDTSRIVFSQWARIHECCSILAAAKASFAELPDEEEFLHPLQLTNIVVPTSMQFTAWELTIHGSALNTSCC